MKMQKRENNHFDMANRIYRQIKEQQYELYRLFRVYHPVYEISVNIETEQIDDSYHIIEKYMDKLVCGYIGEKKSLGEGIFIKNKDELFELLGIDHQAYEIAENFYRDLIEAGHYEEVPGLGIRGLKAAQESIKLEKRVTSATVKQKKLFDQFSSKLLPGAFYDIQMYACDRESVNENSPNQRNSVWLEPNVTVFNSAVDIDQMLGNFNYVNSERIDRGLPQGFKSMSIAKDEPVSLSFYPYYLAILRHGEDFDYKAFRIDNGQPLEWIGEQYKSGYYQSVVDLFDVLSKITETVKNVENPLNRNFSITKNGAPSGEDGIIVDSASGNYEWTLLDWQIEDLLGLGEDKKFKRGSCLMIANNEIDCLTSYEAGKIIKINKSEEQRKILLTAAQLESEEREDLFQNYLKERGEKATIVKQKETKDNTKSNPQNEATDSPTEEQKEQERVITVEELSDAEKTRISEAIQLFNQKRYVDAMETFIEFAERDATSSRYLAEIYYFAYGVTKDYKRASYWYNISSDLGDRMAQYNLGILYQYGQGVETNLEKAFILFEKSANQGYLNAMYKMAKCYDSGQGIDKDEVKALEWYRKAIESGREKDYFDIAYLLAEGSEKVRNEAEAIRYYELAVQEGNAAACCNLGVMYLNGRGVEKDINKAIEYYELGSDRGNNQAKYNLAGLYERGVNGSKNIEKAFSLYEEAALNGHPDSMIKLGRYYARGIVVKRDKDEAIKWLDKAAQFGSPNVFCSIAYLYDSGPTIIRNKDKAIYYYEKAMEGGNIEAEARIGNIYYNDKTNDNNLKKSVELFESASKKGSQYAHYCMGRLYEKGDYYTRDYSKALDYYKKAGIFGIIAKAFLDKEIEKAKEDEQIIERFKDKASDGDAVACFELATVYERGSKTHRNYQKALEYYNLAKDGGNITAITRIGYMHFYGNGVLKDRDKGVDCYLQASQLGDGEAKWRLGYLYEFGIHLTKNKERALELYEEALNVGFNEAEKSINSVRKKIINEAIALYKKKQYIDAMETFLKFGHIDANCSFYLGVMYDFSYGVVKDDKKASYWYKVSADLGDCVAQFNLGNNYQNGRGVEKNLEKSFELFKKSANQGYADSMYKVARFYDLGQGTIKDEVKALEWYRKAIESGRKKDYFYIAYLLAEGSEKVRNEAEAAKYYELAIKEGSAAACCNLGSMYFAGNGVKQDNQKGLECYELGSARGNNQAKYNLAHRYEDGRGVPKDLKKALELFEEAANAGHADARNKLEEVKIKIEEENAR